MSVFEILKERGFIEQVTHEEEVKELLDKEKVTFYIGFDPTADSLHVGHFIQVIVMMHMQRAGHVPIAIIGGGTAKVGDPSGKTDMRKMMTNETIIENGRKMKAQMSKYLNLDGVNGHFVNNADWLDNLNYIEFLREYGSKFSVNRMLAAECFKQRLEKGLSFLEFNYMIMQAYDFLELNKRYNCKMQLGGNDQWSNIIAGVNLIRKAEQGDAFGLTFKLLTTSEGKKMGKTEKGAIWIDPEKTSPFEMYQYFRNVDDADVENCLALLTFLPMDEVRRLGSLEGSEINKAKEVLAYEFTKLVHGEEEATKAQDAARSLFSGGMDSSNIPSSPVTKEALEKGLDLLDVLCDIGFIKTRGEGKRLVKQGGIYVNEVAVEDFAKTLTVTDLDEDKITIRKGKKVFHQLKL
ncbi:MAG: tyrosine--tRNA ligase [Clostridia bacterium]|nr:tyrosine--tRNA ligase [Clostridia bacterium]